MMDVLIRKMQSRDQLLLADSFPQIAPAHFESYYLDQLTKRRIVFVAMQQRAGEGRLLGYVTLLWEAPYTQFWRRRIPEIVDLNVVAAYRRQGIGSALLAQCELAARQQNYRQIGISVLQDAEEYQAANQLYRRLGYTPDGFGPTPADHAQHLVKAL